MAQYTFRDIEEFLLDDDFFQWARYGFSDNGFDIKFYKIQHPGCEEKIELAIAVIQNMKVVEDSKPVSEEYKMQSFARMMDRLQHESSQPVQLHKKTLPYRRVMAYVASVASLTIHLFGDLLYSIQIQFAENYRCYSQYYRLFRSFRANTDYFGW